jgi:hypothetical protein
MLNYQGVGVDPCLYSWNILEQFFVQAPGFAVFCSPGLPALFHGEVLQQRWQSPVLGRRQRFFTSDHGSIWRHTQELDGQLMAMAPLRGFFEWLMIVFLMVTSRPKVMDFAWDLGCGKKSSPDNPDTP